MAVFTPVSLEEARRFARDYALGEVEALDPVAHGVENTNYRAHVDGRDYALTLFERRVREEDLPFVFALTAHLADKGYPAPRPQAHPEGGVVGRLNDRPAAWIAWLPGDWPRAPSPAQLDAGGAALADLHEASDDFAFAPATPNRYGPAAWRDLADACRARAPDDPLGAELAAAVTAISARWPRDLPTGAIHGDYFPDNVLYEGDRVTGVIDYYFACVDARAYDLAVAINAWAFDAAGAFQADACARFCRAYADRRPLAAAERAALPTLCAGAAARFTLSRLYDVLHAEPDALVTLKDPAPFAARLRFHQNVDDPAVYGL